MFSMLFIMINVKIIVLLFCIASCACYSKYCKICANHVLCKYPIQGPSIWCKRYDKNSLLTDDDINDLVNQINERRNFVAMGNSIRLSGAANMKKIVWSEKLAIFAQRWVDQCDPSLRPDKEDQCRDLENKKVGQNIASILNPSKDFNVKSFVEMWFMKILDYTGRVTYYDSLQDYNSNPFIQLIWADTESVGCGKAKFNVNNIVVERIVCNFSPKGNVHGKPVYTIGLPGSQCGDQMRPDEKFIGLCIQQPTAQSKVSSSDSTVSSLLRILNLSNDSVKQEIDPIYNNIKQINLSTNEMESPRNQIIRHVIRNNLISKSPQETNFWESPMNVTRNHEEYFRDRDKDRPRISHTHIFKYTDQPLKADREDFRKHKLRISSTTPYFENINKVYLMNKCTRSTESVIKDYEHSSTIPNYKITYPCTRGISHECKIIIQGSEATSVKYNIEHVVPQQLQQLCPCGTRTTTSATSNSRSSYNLNCQCINSNDPTIRCPHLLRRATAEYHDGKMLHKETYPIPDYETDWLHNNGRENNPYSQRSTRYIHNNRKRQKREFKDISTFIPFWQLDTFSNDKNIQLKALRYTTLLNRRRPGKKYSSKPVSTESITINFKKPKHNLFTEKYLSFEELLHLRKLNQSNYNARRKMEPTVLNATEEKETTVYLTERAIERREMDKVTSEYTTNTPFLRIRQCTRKLTCTWTAASLTDSNGSIIPGAYGGYGQGSKTPPGYVDGCTRTSTCTRDYMERNKFPTQSYSSTNDDDADYCERRSLNIKKRKSNRYKRHLVGRCQKGYSNFKKHDIKVTGHKTLIKSNLKMNKRRNANDIKQYIYQESSAKNM